MVIDKPNKMKLVLLTICAVLVATSMAYDQLPVACACPRNYDPLCASDGETYSNECLFNCQRTRSASLRILARGTCSDSVLTHFAQDNPQEV
ncbi:hypothetical protein NQ314_007314 [Rhamnusium bicolor]|uniref:Kazal-like domain-containing protein n=1 Tax=Rhamnusium bicolor TaxID=1586634 RepID=A0AAV8YRY3_9CUCU|nr:hypothetical protein NQ314_007314 [Rhamnusium bicolor]